MWQAFLNIFRIPDLRKRVFFTLVIILVYRVGFWIPLPGVNQDALKDFAQTQQTAADQGGFGRIMGYMSIFSGGSFSQSTIFGLGIMPYITASIIFQLFQTLIPRLQDLRKEGAGGQQKITEWTRYATVGLCIIQGLMWLKYLAAGGPGHSLVKSEFLSTTTMMMFYYAAGLTGLTAGSVFLMWLGEQIDKYGIGNGVSIILTVGILARMPDAVWWVVQHFDPRQSADPNALGLPGLLFLVAAFVFVVAGAILITVAQRRIPIQQARHTRGQKVYGGQRHYLPIRVNHAGVMPIIFASSLMIFPSSILGWLAKSATGSGGWWEATANFLANNFNIGTYPYVVFEILLIYFFSFFWTTVVFSPEDMARQLRDHGSFIPGLRPGPRTAEYLETVIERITYVGAGFLAIIAVIPTVVTSQMGIHYMVSSFLGGTGLLIVVSVGLDLIQRIEANLLMHNYSGFLGGDAGGGPRIRGRRG